MFWLSPLCVRRGQGPTWISRDLHLVSLGAGQLANCTCCSGICLQPATGDVALGIGMKLAQGKCSLLLRTFLDTIAGLWARAYELAVNPEAMELEPLGPTVTDTEGQVVANPSTGGPAMALATARSIAEYAMEVGTSDEHPLEVLDLRAAFWQAGFALSGTVLHAAAGDLHGPASNGADENFPPRPLPKLVLGWLDGFFWPIAARFAATVGGTKLCEASCDVWSCIPQTSFMPLPKQKGSVKDIDEVPLMPENPGRCSLQTDIGVQEGLAEGVQVTAPGIASLYTGSGLGQTETPPLRHWTGVGHEFLCLCMGLAQGARKEPLMDSI